MNPPVAPLDSTILPGGGFGATALSPSLVFGASSIALTPVLLGFFDAANGGGLVFEGVNGADDIVFSIVLRIRRRCLAILPA